MWRSLEFTAHRDLCPDRFLFSVARVLEMPLEIEYDGQCVQLQSDKSNVPL